MRRSRWKASKSRKTLRKPPGGSASSTRCGKSRSFTRPVISRLRRVIRAVRSMLCLRQFAFSHNTLMLFVCTFDAIFELAPIVRELFGHFVDPAWHIATDCGHEGHALTDMEFMRGHRGPLSSLPNRVLAGLAHRAHRARPDRRGLETGGRD